jgi:excinuclease ABC subunit A
LIFLYTANITSLPKSSSVCCGQVTKYFRGLDAFFKEMEEQTYKIQYSVLLSRYRGKTTCPECKGSRLRKDASYVKIDGMSITDVVLMPLDKALEFLKP